MTRNQVRLMVDELAEDARQADPPPAFLHDGPVPRPKNWLDLRARAVDRRRVGAGAAQRGRGTPFGETRWMERAAWRLGLESTLRPRGRPRKETEK
jgi:putative transposase